MTMLMRSSRASFPCSVGSVTEGRRWVRQTLVDWGLPGVAQDAELAVSELLSNVVRHAGTPPTVTVEAGDALTVTVADGAGDVPSLPVQGERGADRSGGQGLRIVAAVADQWGVQEVGPGKAVWFRLELDPPDGEGARLVETADRPNTSFGGPARPSMSRPVTGAGH